MKIGFRILGSAVVVFGVDDSGDPLPPDIGTKGYLALSAMARQRGGKGTGAAEPSEAKLIRLIEAAQSDADSFLPDGFYIVEVLGPGTDSGLHLYDGSGTHLLGPVQDAADIVMAKARQS